jgi:mediator of replication checkpoint protein 1
VSQGKGRINADANAYSAENPKKLAFLRAIEDRDESDGIDYLGDMEDSNGITDSHPDGTQDEQQPFPAVQDNPAGATANMSLKRKLPTDFTVLALGNENIVPNMSHRRRAAANDGMTAKRPTTIAEIRESLSFLIDEPLISDSQISDNSDDDDDGNYDAEEDEVNNGPLRRVRQKRNDGNGSAVLTTVRASIINRLTVSRNNSMSIDEDGVSSGPMAFHTTNSASGGGFKVPNLLRRATANLSTSNSSSGTTTPTTNENAVRMGGSKRSNIHFQAREAERMKKVQEVERRRREGIRKSVVRKGRMSVLGNSLAGRNSGFE